MGRLDGKIVAVTGGASGIGEATVRRFLAEGARVAFCDRDGERGQRVAAELETAGAKVAFTQADVGTEDACLAFVNGAAQKFGRLAHHALSRHLKLLQLLDTIIRLNSHSMTPDLLKGTLIGWKYSRRCIETPNPDTWAGVGAGMIEHGTN
jgi:NAD(P)-dependent dehydrogenase (short-subunit alcohol dehydrogenase family)